jgi:hypothetical protein
MRLLKKILKISFLVIFANFSHNLWNKNHVLKKVGRGIWPIFKLIFSDSTCSGVSKTSYGFWVRGQLGQLVVHQHDVKRKRTFGPILSKIINYVFVQISVLLWLWLTSGTQAPHTGCSKMTTCCVYPAISMDMIKSDIPIFVANSPTVQLSLIGHPIHLV